MECMMGKRSYYFFIASNVLLFVACISLVACMTKITTYGINATDLSSLHIGMKRYKLDELLGVPEILDISDNSVISANTYTAKYTFNRGYTPKVEDRPGERPIAFTVGLALDVFTAGTAYFLDCGPPCQKAILVVRFDASDELVNAYEAPAPVTGCCAPARKCWSACAEVRGRLHPSTLPRAVKTLEPAVPGL